MSDENGTARVEVPVDPRTPAQILYGRLENLKAVREQAGVQLAKLDAQRAELTKLIHRYDGGIIECEKMRKILAGG